ncbi:MAG: DUF58 domain-containing protein [Planctomycetales bacterium]|nr:DUF58 domain-containing protein [Planctomycetales bacterium]
MGTNPYLSSEAPAGARSSWIDPATLMRIKSLQVRAKAVMEGFFSGLHRSPYHGFSVEFSEYRQYTPGDDPRYLDWKLYARTDRYYIKRFEDETNLRCHLLVDLSRSMSFGSLSYTKADYAKTCAATLGYFLSTQRDGVGLLTFDQGANEFIPARHRPGHIQRIFAALDRAESGETTRLAPPLEQVAQHVRRRSMVVLISDLLADVEGLEYQLGCLKTQGHEVLLLRVVDPAEETLDFDGPALFRDLETGRELYVDPVSARSQYQRRFNEHLQRITTMCQSLGIELSTFNTQRPLELSLFDLLNFRMRQGRGVQRHSQTGKGAR